MAISVSDILLKIAGTNEDARRALRETAAEVAAFNQVDAEVTIRANPKDALAKMAEVDTALTLIGKRKVSASVKVDIKDAQAKLVLLKAEMDHALKGGVGARPLSDVTNDLGALAGQIASFGGELEGIGAKGAAAMDNIGAAVVSTGAKVGGSLVGGLVTIGATIGLIAVGAAVLVPIIVALTGVIVALAASLAAAAAGAAALLTSGLFALAPIAAVAGVTVLRLVGAVKALQTAEKDRLTVAKDLRTADEAHTAALKAKQDATKNLSQAEVDAAHAERDAILAVKDAQLSLDESKLGIADAAIGLERAKDKLKDLKAEAADTPFGDLLKKATNIDATTDQKTVEGFVSKVAGTDASTDKQLDIKQALLDVAHAQLQVKTAKESEVHATNDLSDAQERNNKFVQEGIKAYAPYVEALKQVAATDKGLTDTSNSITDIRQKAAAATSKYSKGELDAGRQILSIWTSVKDILKPAEAGATGGIVDLLKGVASLVSDPGIKEGLTGVGDAIGGIAKGFGALLQTREVKDTFAAIASSAGRLLSIIGGPIAQDFFLILLRIAHVAGPALEDLFHDFASFMDRIAHGSSDTKKLEGGVGSVVSSFRSWLSLVRAVGRAIVAVFRGGKDDGDSLVKTLTRIINKFADVYGNQEGQERLKRFFDDSFTKAAKFWTQLKDIYNVFNDLVKVVDLLAKALKGLALITGLGPLAKLIGGISGGIAGGGNILHSILHPGLAAGGFVNAPSTAGVDNVLQPLAGGEFVLRADVVKSIGLPALNSLNSGSSFHPAMAAPAGHAGTQQDFHGDIVLPAAAGGGIGDERDAAVKFGRELKRRGRGR